MRPSMPKHRVSRYGRSLLADTQWLRNLLTTQKDTLTRPMPDIGLAVYSLAFSPKVIDMNTSTV